MIAAPQPAPHRRMTRRWRGQPGALQDVSSCTRRPVIFHIGADAPELGRTDDLSGHSYQVRTFRSLAAAGPSLRRCELLLAPAGELTAEALDRILGTVHPPKVIALHEPGAKEAGLLALERGADDAFPSDGSPRELLARVRALLRRRRHQSGAESTSLARMLEDPGGPLRRLRLAGVLLSPREFDLLLALARRPGHVRSRAELMDLLRDAAEVYDRSVDSAVHRLRRKFAGASLRDPIITHRAVGYALHPEALGDWPEPVSVSSADAR